MDHVFLFVIFCLLYISLRWNLGYYLINFISRPKFSSFYDIHYGSNPVVKGVFVFFTVLVTAVVFQVWQIDVIVLVRGFVSWCHEALLLHIREPLHHRCSGNTESRWVIKPQEEGIAQSQRQDLFVADANKLRWRNLSQWQDLGHLFDDGLCSTLLHVWRHKSSSPAQITWLFLAAPYILPGTYAARCCRGVAATRIFLIFVFMVSLFQRIGVAGVCMLCLSLLHGVVLCRAQHKGMALYYCLPGGLYYNDAACVVVLWPPSFCGHRACISLGRRISADTGCAGCRLSRRNNWM